MPGSSDCNNCPTLVASTFLISSAVITRVMIGASFSNLGVRVPVTTTVLVKLIFR